MYLCLDGCLKALYRKRKLCYGYNQWKHESVRRKRRLCDKGLVVYSDGGGGLSSESVTNSPVKGESGTLSVYILMLCYLTGLVLIFSHAMWCSLLFAVKLSIKSFRIPELFIEVPGTATVGSLKVCDD